MNFLRSPFKQKPSDAEDEESLSDGDDSGAHALIYAIGDVHGQVTMLRRMLDTLRAVPLRDEDVILFLGDYIDRGEDTRAVIDTLLALREERPNTVFLRGNHENLLLLAKGSEAPRPHPAGGEVILSDETLLWFQNGGDQALLSYHDDLTDDDLLRWWEFIPEEHWSFFWDTRLEYVTARYHFVHAGLLPPGKTWEGQARGMDERLWIREPFLSSKHDFGKVVVFGHTPLKQPLIQSNKVGLDTGAVFGGSLTAAAFDPLYNRRIHGRKLPPPRVFQVPFIEAEL